MIWKTIQKRMVHKHLQYISNIQLYTLDNQFSGEFIESIGSYGLENGKMEVNVIQKKGKLRVHSNWWYHFDYNKEAKETNIPKKDEVEQALDGLHQRANEIVNGSAFNPDTEAQLIKEEQPIREDKGLGDILQDILDKKATADSIKKYSVHYEYMTKTFIRDPSDIGMEELEQTIREDAKRLLTENWFQLYADITKEQYFIVYRRKVEM